MPEPLGFDVFYARTQRRLLRQLTLVTLDAEQAADALQEAYVRAWQHWDRVSTYDDPESWVRTVAYRHSVSTWRRLLTARRAAPRIAAPDRAEPVASADVLAVRAALASLSYDQRAVLVLHEMCDLAIDEIAVLLRVPRGTVKSRLARGRSALGALLSEDGSAPSTAPPDPPSRAAADQVRTGGIRHAARRPVTAPGEVGDVLGS